MLGNISCANWYLFQEIPNADKFGTRVHLDGKVIQWQFLPLR